MPGGPDEPLRTERSRLDSALHIYRQQSQQLGDRLGDLEQAVDELRDDVLQKRARVDNEHVEQLAVQLNSVSKALSKMKGERKRNLTAHFQITRPFTSATDYSVHQCYSNLRLIISRLIAHA